MFLFRKQYRHPAALCFATVASHSLSHRGVEFGLVIGVLPLPGKEEIDDLLRARQTADMGGEDPHGPDRTRCDRSLPSQ
jgi:hypothetical protein